MVLGISRDSIEENRAFADKFDFDFPLLCDVDGTVSLAYGAISDPSQRGASRITYVIDPKGTIAKTYPKVNPASHPAEILSSL